MIASDISATEFHKESRIISGALLSQTEQVLSKCARQLLSLTHELRLSQSVDAATERGRFNEYVVTLSANAVERIIAALQQANAQMKNAKPLATLVKTWESFTARDSVLDTAKASEPAPEAAGTSTAV